MSHHYLFKTLSFSLIECVKQLRGEVGLSGQNLEINKSQKQEKEKKKRGIVHGNGGLMSATACVLIETES